MDVVRGFLMEFPRRLVQIIDGFLCPMLLNWSGRFLAVDVTKGEPMLVDHNLTLSKEKNADQLFFRV